MSWNGNERFGAQEPTLLHLPAGIVSSAGQECADLAASAGLFLDPWQVAILDGSLSERRGGKWAAFEVAEIVPRQNGKNGVVEARQLGGLFLFRERLQVHSAHEFKTALEHFIRIRQLIEMTPDLYRKVKIIRTGSADMSVELKSGQRLRFVARSDSSGRGMTGDAVYLDEAYAVNAKMLGALVPTMRARPNPQLWYMSSAPKFDSVFLHALLGRAGDKTERRLYLAAWENAAGIDPADRDAWWRVNPAMGIRITEEAMADELKLLGSTEDGLAEFMRECLGVRESQSGQGRPVKIPAAAWALTAIDRRVAVAMFPAMRALAFDVARDGEWATVAVGAGSQQAPYVEVIDHHRGVGWLPERLVQLVSRHGVTEIGCNGAGPAGAQVGPVMAALAAAGMDAVKVRQLSAVEYKQACGAFYTDVVEIADGAQRPRLMRIADGQAPLDAAVADATERALSDAWAWDLRNVSVPVSPLVAVTIARALLDPEPPPYSGPMFHDLSDYLDDEE